MTNSLALPSVCDVNQSVSGLNDRRVAEFAGFRFEYQRGFSLFAVSRDGYVQGRAAFRIVVIDNHVSAIVESHGIGPGVRTR